MFENYGMSDLSTILGCVPYKKKFILYSINVIIHVYAVMVETYYKVLLQKMTQGCKAQISAETNLN